MPKERRPTLRRTGQILVVSDECATLRLVQVNLERQGYILSKAASKDAALEEIRQSKPDLIVLDTMLGDQTGSVCPSPDTLDFIKAVKSDPHTRTTPITYIHPDKKKVDRFLGGHTTAFDCFVFKPFNPMELIAFVKRIFKSLEHYEGSVIY